MSPRLDFLDSARGVATMDVLIFHLVLALGKKNSDQKNFHFIFEEYSYFGKIAAIVFFVISGLFVPYSIRSNDKKH